MRRVLSLHYLSRWARSGLGFWQAGAPSKGLGLLHRQSRVAWLALDQVEGGNGCGYARWRQAGRINQRPGTVAHQFNNRGRRTQVPAVGAGRFRQSSHLKRHWYMRVADKT